MENQTVYPYGQNGTLPSGYPIADDLDTNSAQQALSARQGVILKKGIDEKDWAFMQIDLSLFGVKSGSIDSTTWGGNSKNENWQIPVSQGERYRIVGPAHYAFLTVEQDWTNGGSVSFPSGYEGRVMVGRVTVDIVIPEGCTALYLLKSYSGGTIDITPSAFYKVFPFTNDIIKSQLDGMNDVRGDIERLSGEVELFDYDACVVSSTNVKIVIEKYGNNGLRIYNKESCNGVVFISLPSGLVAGRKYRVRFKYVAQLFGKYAVGGWWLNVANNSAYTSLGYGLKSKKPERAEFTFVFQEGDLYLRLVSSSMGTGSVAYIEDLSFVEDYKSVVELDEAIKNGGNDIENYIRQARFVAYNTTTPPLVLLHFSDIHGDSVAAEQIKWFATKYAQYIDDLVQTGDAVYTVWNSSGRGYEWYQQNGIPEALFVIGNHDGAANDNSHGWAEDGTDQDFKGKEWDFDTYFADYIATRGVTPPDGYDDPESPYYKALYWHKDYDTQKIRVIGLDCLHFNDGVRYTSNDQETWLAAKLQETLTSGNAAYGYSVVFLCHYPLDDYSGMNETWDNDAHKFIYNQNQNGGCVMDRRTQQPVTVHYGTSFTAVKKHCMRNRVGSVGDKNYTKGNDNPIADVIQSWMNSGGKYLAWLSGHTHNDYMYYPEKYPQMLVIGLPQAGNSRGNDSFADRDSDSAEHCCANLIVFDTQTKRIKIVRVGKTTDRDFKDQRVLSFAYEYKNVLGGGV